MKRKFLYTIFLCVLLSCSKNEDIIVENSNPNNVQNLGLTATNNIYPNWPDTWTAGLGDNQWYDTISNDTLTVSRRDQVTEDSGDWLYYTFKLKNGWIYPLNIKRISTDAYIEPPRFNQLMYNKPIVKFKIQQYTVNQILACEIETSNGDYYMQNVIIDKMWIDLTN